MSPRCLANLGSGFPFSRELRVQPAILPTPASRRDGAMSFTAVVPILFVSVSSDNRLSLSSAHGAGVELRLGARFRFSVLRPFCPPPAPEPLHMLVFLPRRRSSPKQSEVTVTDPCFPFFPLLFGSFPKPRRRSDKLRCYTSRRIEVTQCFERDGSLPQSLSSPPYVGQLA